MKTSYVHVDAAVPNQLAATLLSTSFAGTPLVGTPETDDESASGILVATDGKTFACDGDSLPEADERATDGSTRIARFDGVDGVTVFLETGEMQNGLHIYPAGTCIKTLLREFDTCDLDMAQHLASWGFDGTPEAASEDATDVRIWCQPSYYVGTLGAPIGHYVYAQDSGDRDPLVFATCADAQAWIDEAESGAYYLSSGEAGRPAYTICD